MWYLHIHFTDSLCCPSPSREATYLHLIYSSFPVTTDVKSAQFADDVAVVKGSYREFATKMQKYEYGHMIENWSG